MNCPVCQNHLNSVPAGQVVVDACLGGCGGIWFDNFELTKLDQHGQVDVDLLVAVNVAEHAVAAADPARKRRCPKCVDIVMMRHFFSQQRRVEVDECPNCGGYWLDAGELALVREECQAEGDCQLAIEKHLAATAGKKLGEMRTGSREQMKRAQAIDRLFQFTGTVRYQRQAPTTSLPTE